MPDQKIVYIVGGPNGSGKTTFVKLFLPKYIETKNFINADDIASGLSPLNYAAMNLRSGRLMLELIDEYRGKGIPFGFETTLAGKKWVSLFQGLKQAGYKIYLFFLDTASVELAVKRVRYRVESGGHDIPEETIRRRYARCRRNFWYNYKKLADNWFLFDNSGKEPELIANYLGDRSETIDKKYLDLFLGSLQGK